MSEPEDPDFHSTKVYVPEKREIMTDTPKKEYYAKLQELVPASELEAAQKEITELKKRLGDALGVATAINHIKSQNNQLKQQNTKLKENRSALEVIAETHADDIGAAARGQIESVTRRAWEAEELARDIRHEFKMLQAGCDKQREKLKSAEDLCEELAKMLDGFRTDHSFWDGERNNDEVIAVLAKFEAWKKANGPK